jgi:PqqD family protein of HPr-rel-A system
VDEAAAGAAGVPPDWWTGCDAGSVVWRTWGDETAVYDAATGNTHLLTPLAGRVFEWLLTAPDPLTMPAIVRRATAAGYFVDADEVQETLAALQAIGLARAVAH